MKRRRGRPTGSVSQKAVPTALRRAAAFVQLKIIRNHYWRGETRVPASVTERYIEQALSALVPIDPQNPAELVLGVTAVKRFPSAKKSIVLRHLQRNDVIANYRWVKKPIKAFQNRPI